MMFAVGLVGQGRLPDRSCIGAKHGACRCPFGCWWSEHKQFVVPDLTLLTQDIQECVHGVCEGREARPCTEFAT